MFLCRGLKKRDVIRSQFNGCSTCANATFFQSFPALYKTPLSWRNTRFVHKSDDLQKIARVFHDVTPRECNLSKQLTSSRSNHQHCCCRHYYTHTLPVSTQKCLESLYDSWLALQISPQPFFNRCKSTSLRCCIHLASFLFTMSQVSTVHCSNELRGLSSFCTASCNPTTTVRRAVGFLHKIPLLQDFLACPLSWFSQTSVQARSR